MHSISFAFSNYTTVDIWKIVKWTNNETEVQTFENFCITDTRKANLRTFGRLLNPPLVLVKQNILQQNKFVTSIQNKALSHFRLFCKHHDRRILSYVDFSSPELILIRLNRRRMQIKCRNWTMYQDLKNENAQVKWWKKMLNIGPVLFLEIGNS